MNKQTTASLAGLVLITSCTPSVVADVISGSMRATSHFSDNTLKVSEDDNPQEERQDYYDASLAVNYENSFLESEVNYQVHARKFADHSQEDDEYVDGNSLVVIGKNDDPASLRLEHSRVRLLSAPDAVDLVQNQREREIVSAMPELRSRFGKADYIFVRGLASLVRFPDSGLQDSKRTGYVAGWSRPVSGVSNFELMLQQTDIKYDESPEADYTYSTAVATYKVQLRKLSYQLGIGFNRSAPEVGDSQSEPSYVLNVGYQSGYQQFDLEASRQLTDTSVGSGNGQTNLPGNDGYTSLPERIDRNRAELRWTTEVLCERCKFSVGGVFMEDDYLNKDQQTRTVQSDFLFGYNFSSASNLNFRYIKTDFKSDYIAQLANGSVMNDYDLKTFAIEYVYRFRMGIELRILGRKDERVSDNPKGTYDENIYGAGIGYVF